MSPSSSSSARLDVTQGPLRGQSLQLTVPETIIGRETDCQLPLSSYREVSRHHARIYLQNGTWCLEDLGSTNGTFVNNVRATPSFSLHDGVQVQMGDFHAHFRATVVGTQPTIPGSTQLSPLPPSTLLPPTYPSAVMPVAIQPYPYSVPYRPEPPKQVALALLFSLLLIGGGQFYNGEITKGIIFLCCAFFFGFLGFLTFGLTWFIGPVIWICNIIDAVQSAERINREAGWPRHY